VRPRIIAGNWKLYKTVREAIDLVTLLKRELYSVRDCRIVVCPPYTAITEVAEVLVDSNIELGAQDLYWEDAGAFTGEVSGPLLKEAGCAYVIVGHSERRQLFGETDDAVNRKLKAALRAGLVPIVCCGETLAEREASRTLDVLRTQITAAYRDVPPAGAAATVVAYEPVWAIGTGRVATPVQAQEAQKYIRSLLASLYSPKEAEAVPILYGGSVKPENAGDILKQPDVDGALVGGASLDARAFAAIVRSAACVRVST
jgi:triosephosphate isomerase